MLKKMFCILAVSALLVGCGGGGDGKGGGGGDKDKDKDKDKNKTSQRIDAESHAA